MVKSFQLHFSVVAHVNEVGASVRIPLRQVSAVIIGDYLFFKHILDHRKIVRTQRLVGFSGYR
jgi:hypothetical protein